MMNFLFKTYKDMIIESLLYLTTNKPNIILDICANFQSNCKQLYFKAIKRIFR